MTSAPSPPVAGDVSGPSRQPSHVIWDWNGTLFDDFAICVEAASVVCQRAGGITIDADIYRQHFTRPVRNFYERLLGRVITDEQWQRIADDYHALYEAALGAAGLRAEAREVLDWVETQGITQSLLSMTSHGKLADLVQRHELASYFLLVHGSQGAMRTESKRILLREHLDKVARLLGRSLPPDEVLVVGDTVDDAEASAEVGVRCVLLADTQYDVDAMARLNYRVATCLRTAVEMVPG